jgi:4-hydroxybenzoate polyprenyltransferase
MRQTGLDRALRILDLLLLVASLLAVVGWMLGLVPAEVLPLLYLPLIAVTIVIRRRGRRSADPPADG